MNTIVNQLNTVKGNFTNSATIHTNSSVIGLSSPPESLYVEASTHFYAAYNSICEWIWSAKNEQEYRYIFEARLSILAAAAVAKNPKKSFSDFKWLPKSKPTTKVSNGSCSFLGNLTDLARKVNFHVNSWIHLASNADETRHLAAALRSIEAASFARSNRTE